ncbi:glycosyltransferase [Reichenbachiella versicolor]|uniref:glycosyltransferase n=1 Tax=Reichenbachiella versicolor TaxID=1821036 RepID=UPI000D6E0E17|nr:glycosyltransferase [Reichenbachiella versicolor]
MSQPLVSIICLCYNQAQFVQRTLESVFNQEYSNLQVIVVDDCSSDNSQEIIKKVLQDKSDIPFLALNQNVGNTKAFNKGLELAKGKYVIDLACDDILYSDKISKQVAFFENQSNQVGLIYSDVRFVDESINELGWHFQGQSFRLPYSGEVYEKVIDTFFIPPQSVMIKREVFEELGGYDESLAYEDFDLWVRASRHWYIAYQGEVLMDVIKHEGSLSNKLYEPNDQQLHSTYKICLKIKDLNRTPSENDALVRRLKYEIRHAVFSANHYEAELMGNLLSEIKGLSFSTHILLFVNKLRVNLRWFRQLFFRLKYG